MNDHLIFGREPGETGDVDVDELKAALAGDPDPVDDRHHEVVTAPDPTPEERARTARRRHRTWLIFAVVVLLITLSGSLWVMYNMNKNMMPLHIEDVKNLP